MDEIDAALDFKNVSIVAFYIYVSNHLEVFVLRILLGSLTIHMEFIDLFLTFELFPCTLIPCPMISETRSFI